MTASPTMREIIEATAEGFDIPIGAILGRRRSRPIVRARQAAAHLIRTRTPRSLPETARALKRADHTTILHAVRMVDELLTRDAGFAESYRAAAARLDSLTAKAPAP